MDTQSVEITTGEAAEILNVSRMRIRQFILQGRLTAIKQFGQIKILDKNEVLRFAMKARPQGRPRKIQ